MVKQLKDLLASHTVEDLPKHKGDVIVVNTTESPLQGFEKLLTHKVQSAPVYDPATGKYTGFLDIRDLVSFCCFIAGNNENADNLLDIVNYGVKMFKYPVEGVTVAYLSRRNPFHAIKKSMTLLEVSELLTTKGVRRVPVVSDSGEVLYIVSQSSIVQYLYTHMREIQSEFSTPIGELHDVGGAPVMSVKKDVKAIEVFRMMDSAHKSGVAVVDDHGMLVGNTSGHDLKLFIHSPSLSVLNLPITTFLNQIRQMQIDIVNPAISSTVTDPFGHVISKISATRVHRIFIVDHDSRPVKVVSLSDILSYITRKA